MLSQLHKIYSNKWMITNDELGRMWEWTWPILRYSTSTCLEGLRKTTKSLPW